MNFFLSASSFLLFKSWPPNIYRYTQVDQYEKVRTGDFYVYQVTFITLSETNTRGGALLINTSTNLHIESSSFINCHSKVEGGAIYFENENGRSFLEKVCSTNSNSRKFHFCLISTKKNNQCTNRMEYSSVANLPTAIDYGNVDLCNSDIIIFRYINISKIQCHYSSAFISFSISKSFVSYTSVENCTSTRVDGADVISFTGYADHYMNTCNVIGCKCGYGGIIFVRILLEISNSCLIENNNCTMFWLDGNSPCKLINCTFDSLKKLGNAPVYVNNTPSESFINNLDINACFSFKDTNITKSMLRCKKPKTIENILKGKLKYIITL